MAPRRLSRLETHELAGGLRLFVARRPISRLLGLAGLAHLPAECGLLLPRCRSVHTFGMRFALDLVFIDRSGWVVRVACGVPAARVIGSRRAVAVLETCAGGAAPFIAAGAERVAAIAARQ
jgi:uncharacterized protein